MIMRPFLHCFKSSSIHFRCFLLAVIFSSVLGSNTVNAQQTLYFPPLQGNAWDTVSPATLGWCQDELDTLLDYLQVNNTKAFLLLKDGKMVVENYFGSFTRDSLWYWASAGKSLTAFAVGIAQQEGLLNIQDTTSDYLGAGWTVCPPIKEEKITIRNQLTMTSGLDDGVPDHYCTLDTCLQYLADAGTRWAYHNGPYTLLDSVIEVASGNSLNNFVNTRIKQQTGMDGFFLPVGYNNVFFSRARSMARFGLLMLNQGNWNGTQVMTDTGYFNAMVQSSQTLNQSYGYLWWLNGKASFMVPGIPSVFPGNIMPNGPSDLVMALGKNGQMLNVVPSMNLVYVRMGDAPGTAEVPLLFNDTIWQKLNAVMCTGVGAQEVNPSIKFQLAPNPASGYFQLRFGSSQTGSILVRDLCGRIVFLEELFNVLSAEIYLNVRAGMYIVQFIDRQGGISSEKLLIE